MKSVLVSFFRAPRKLSILKLALLPTGPKAGTLALDGNQPPDAASNDDTDEGWGFDGSETNGILNGTPGEANPPCP